jgi:hypothetical protein
MITSFSLFLYSDSVCYTGTNIKELERAMVHSNIHSVQICISIALTGSCYPLNPCPIIRTAAAV